MTTPKLFWLFTLAVLLIQAALIYPELPDQMVTHMNLQGKPDGYGSTDQFLLAFGMAVVLINLMPPLVPLLMKKLPASLVNLPNKEYWFANAERKGQAIDKMFDMMALVMGMVNVLFLTIFQQVCDLSLGRPPVIPFWVTWLILPFLILVPPVYLFLSLRTPRP